MIEDAVDPLLHDNEPVKLLAVSVELPQLFCTVTVGATGIVLGAAMPEPAALVHPLTVLVTVYVPAAVTVIEEAVDPLLHNKVPVRVSDKEDERQLFTTVSDGAEGVAPRAAIPEPAALVLPPTVVVTVYVPAAVTVIEEAVAPLLHNKVPVAVVDKVDEPQLFTTVTDGAEGVVFGPAMPEPAALVHPLTVLVTVYVPAAVTVIEAV